MTVIVTGAAGFIGMHTAQRLLDRGETVVGVDNFNTYYDPALKPARSARLEESSRFRMVRMDISDAEGFAALVRETGAKRIVHLAAQAGVRYSIENPFAYQQANLAGHLSVLEAALGREAVKVFKPMQPGDVTATFADVSQLKALTGYDPRVPLEDGIPRFVEWYRSFYG